MAQNTSQPAQPEPASHRKLCRAAWGLLLLAGLHCAFQIAWFWRFTSHNISYDAISYIGIARHLAGGDFAGSLNGYWSPLFSWCIAGLSGFSSNFTLLARLMTIASFLLCLPLLYWLTLHLWHSPLLAAVSVLWFTLARGVAAFSVYFIGADFLFTALALLYFILLIRCLRHPSARNWAILGLLHGVAFLAKAIAFPWLMVSTVLACLMAARRNLRLTLLHAGAALAIPLLVWFSWGLVLKTRYGVFTAGYQSKWNLLDRETRQQVERSASHLTVLRDTTRTLDPDMVVDNMPPASALWQTRVQLGSTIRLILAKERQNLPRALKEIVILLTPGGVLAIILAVLTFGFTHQAETKFAWIVFASAASLVIAYCMLVFDGRYVFPLVPLLMAVAVPFVVPGQSDRFPERFPRGCAVSAALLVASTVFLLLYPASPFRSLRRDYQSSCYDAARKLQAIPSCKKLAVLGTGPYQQHGVGWEAGIYSSYFASCRLAAFSPELPATSQSQSLQQNLQAINPGAILLFGSVGNPAYDAVVSRIYAAWPNLRSESVNDPQAGKVGELFWRPD
jgi:hypothetical protein